MKEKYINIEEKLLKQGYTITQSAIISYLKRFQLNGKYCFQSKRQIADFFNISESTLKRELSKLEKLGVIIISNEKKYIPVTFYNKKAIVYIDGIIETNECYIEEKELNNNNNKDVNWGKFSEIMN
jgi:DNA-binding transcriptional regulator YhcF (GntR family)